MTYFTLQLNSNQSTFKYSFPESFLDKNYQLGLIQIGGSINLKPVNVINPTNNSFIHIFNGVDQNNSQLNEVNIIEITNGKYGLHELIHKSILRAYH